MEVQCNLTLAPKVQAGVTGILITLIIAYNSQFCFCGFIEVSDKYVCTCGMSEDTTVVMKDGA